MKIKELFKIDFKKPELDSEQKETYNKKETVLSKIEECYSRLESIEILNSNSKNLDAPIIAQYLFVDIFNIILFIESQSPISLVLEAKQKINSISNEELKKYLIENEAIISKLLVDEPTLEDSETVENFLSEFLHKVESNLENLNTPLDEYKKRMKFQMVAAAILIFSLFVFSVNVYQNNILKPGNIEMWFMNSANPAPTTTNQLSIPLQVNSNWNVYTFQLPVPSTIEKLRIDPVAQAKVKFQMEYIRYLDSNKNILKERSFIVQPNYMLNDQEQLSNIIGLIPSKNNKAGNIGEMLSTNSDPSFYLNMGNLEKVSFIEIKMRIAKESKEYSPTTK